MPKKINHAGRMQNYVPKGNGDASGEYGDDATGSNIHYKTQGEEGGGISIVSKPPKAKKKEDDPFIKGLKKGFEEESKNSSASFNEEEAKAKHFGIIDKSKISKDEKNDLKEIYSNGSKEAREIMDKYSTTIKYKKIKKTSTCAWYLDKTSEIFLNFIGKYPRGDEEKTQKTFFHENGHSVDFMDRFSCEYKDENGKSMLDTLKEETTEDLKWKIKNDFLDDTIVAETEIGVLSDKNEKIRQELKSQVEANIKESDFITETKNEWGTSHSYDLASYYEAQEKEYERLSPELKANKEKIRASSEEFNRKCSEWSDVSDVYSGAYGNKTRNYLGVSGWGHQTDYWRASPRKRGHEFFAEYFSVISVKDKSEKGKKSYEYMRKYFPKTTGFCDKMFDKMRKGEIK